VAGVVYNVNSLVGSAGLVGIKTGWTEEAGACFMFARDWDVGGHLVRIYGVILGQDTLADAFAATYAVTGSIGPSLEVAQVVRKDDDAASLSAPWASRVSASASEDVSFVLWSGLPVDRTLEATSRTSRLKEGDQIGKIVVVAGGQRQEIPLLAKGNIQPARLSWRLTRLPW
jgi:D-alanyl-D-alanine carboxypeptidase (penicillin-binding protein 5/6)